ncbi:MAG: hypothetical protein H6940_06165 [Burkholderiales bacterium]|nr:hypothetical protein [Burkholderiales bacterium]
MLETASGFELPAGLLVPKDKRPSRKEGKKSKKNQLEQIANAARNASLYATDFLSGDLERFNAQSEPLPPYKQKIG